jgi:hypothetical protein
MVDEIELLQIVERIYDAATDATRFRHLAKDIAQAFDAESAWLFTGRNARSGQQGERAGPTVCGCVRQGAP